jgi:hypothetical protein
MEAAEGSWLLPSSFNITTMFAISSLKAFKKAQQQPLLDPLLGARPTAFPIPADSSDDSAAMQSCTMRTAACAWLIHHQRIRGGGGCEYLVSRWLSAPAGGRDGISFISLIL